VFLAHGPWSMFIVGICGWLGKEGRGALSLRGVSVSVGPFRSISCVVEAAKKSNIARSQSEKRGSARGVIPSFLSTNL
jgi:hypothetical protein